MGCVWAIAMNKLLVISIVIGLLSGCAMDQHRVRVIQSPETITDYKFNIDENDSIICDKEGCRILRGN